MTEWMPVLIFWVAVALGVIWYEVASWIQDEIARRQYRQYQQWRLWHHDR